MSAIRWPRPIRRPIRPGPVRPGHRRSRPLPPSRRSEAVMTRTSSIPAGSVLRSTDPGRLVALWLLVVLSEATPCVSHAEAARPHELSIGMGNATSWENSVFNLPFDHKSSPSAFYHLAYRFNVTPRLAWGLHVYGTEEVIGDYLIEDPAGVTRPLRFDLSTFNYGAHARW